MVNLEFVKSAFVFFKEFVWGNINLKSFLYQHRLILLALLSNVILSGMFIFFAEQAIVRTQQYREQKIEITELKAEIKRLNDFNNDLDVKLEYLNSVDQCSPDVNTTANKLITNYDIWIENVRRNNEIRRKRNKKKRDEALEKLRNGK